MLASLVALAQTTPSAPAGIIATLCTAIAALCTVIGLLWRHSNGIQTARIEEQKAANTQQLALSREVLTAINASVTVLEGTRETLAEVRDELKEENRRPRGR